MKIQSVRHQTALDYALKTIENSALNPYVKRVILYGSCARGEEKYTSDVDILVVLDESFLKKKEELRRELRVLQGAVTTDDIDDPETDMKIVIGNDWKDSRLLYFRNICKEGVDIWI